MELDVKDFVSDVLPDGSGGSGPEHVLGVIVTERRLHALLVECGGEGTRVRRRFTRQLGGAGGGGFGGEFGDENDLGGGMPGMGMGEEETSGEDFDISFGEGGGSDAGEVFLGSEFGDIDSGGGDANAFGVGGGGAGGDGGASVSGFSLELSDLLEECASAGYSNPALAFCLPAADVTKRELELPDVDAPEEGATLAVEDVGRKTLRKALEAQYEGALEKGRFAFLPMTPSDDGSDGSAARFLALIGQPTDPVVSTLRTMNERGERLPGQGLMETEISLYFGLAQAALRNAGAEQEDALVVRVDDDDALALFSEGASLRHTETLRSLTAQDDPETICSRVLLLQDEYGIDDMQHVFVVSSAQEDALVESFEMFFPDAHVEPLRRHLPAETITDDDEHAVASVSATAAALRLAGHAGYDDDFADVDLLPPKLLTRRFTLPFSSAVPVLLALLAVAGIFFGVRYQYMAGQQAEVRERLNAYPENAAEATPQQLQADIDSVKAASERYLQALQVLDDLLMGSDQWSHALAEISRETAAVSGIWVEEWSPRSGSVQLSGNATSRDHIVKLAERTNGKISSVTFSEIRKWPVYSFTMEVPLKQGLPAATKYLREQALASGEQGAGGQGASGQNAGGRPPDTAAAAQ
jgi:hypothetical protein